MTYFGFLVIFLFLPIVVLLVVNWWDRRNGRELPAAMRAFPPAAAIALHAVIALLYTTAWDNYLVATKVWWYDPAKVTGITLGWVPIEEYTFFVVQPVLAGLWLLFIFRRVKLPSTANLRPTLRYWSVGIMVVLWIASVVLLASGQEQGIYLGLILVWAVPPIGLQLAFGADILWRYRRAVALTLVPLVLFLSAADALAIFDGIWEISLAKSTGILLGGILPLEEFLFFLVTNTLVTFGVTLVMAQASHERFDDIRAWLRREGNAPNGALRE